MKILVIKRDKIGDMLLTTPLLAHLRASLPQAEIHVLANDYNAWVLRGNPHVDRLWVYQRLREGKAMRWRAVLPQLLQLIALRRTRFDFVLVANGGESPRAIKRGLRIGACRVVAYCNRAADYPGLSDPLPVPERTHEARCLLGLAVPLGLALPDTMPLPSYVLSEESRRFAQEWLAEQGLRAGGYIVLGLGARRPKKQPATEQILRWAEHFKRAWGLDTVFMWTPGKSDNPLYPGDDAVAQPVLDAGSAQIRPFRGPLQPALGLIWHARMSLFPDSGLMHFAAASPGGVLGFFAETDVSPHPAHWAPLGRNVDYFDAPRAVADLPDELVLSKVERLLAGSRWQDGQEPGGVFPAV